MEARFGPVRISCSKFGMGYLADWTHEGKSFHQEINPKWNSWILGNLSMDQITGKVESFLPLPLLWGHEDWVKSIQQEMKKVLEDSETSDPDLELVHY